jgi:hypothetical protein
MAIGVPLSCALITTPLAPRPKTVSGQGNVISEDLIIRLSGPSLAERDRKRRATTNPRKMRSGMIMEGRPTLKVMQEPVAKSAKDPYLH